MSPVGRAVDDGKDGTSRAGPAPQIPRSVLAGDSVRVLRARIILRDDERPVGVLHRRAVLSQGERGRHQERHPADPVLPAHRERRAGRPVRLPEGADRRLRPAGDRLLPDQPVHHLHLRVPGAGRDGARRGHVQAHHFGHHRPGDGQGDIHPRLWDLLLVHQSGGVPVPAGPGAVAEAQLRLALGDHRRRDRHRDHAHPHGPIFPRTGPAHGGLGGAGQPGADAGQCVRDRLFAGRDGPPPGPPVPAGGDGCRRRPAGVRRVGGV